MGKSITKRALAIAAVAGASGLSLLGATPGQAVGSTGSEWLQPGWGPGQGGMNRDELALTAANASSLREVARRSRAGVGTPVVVDGIVVFPTVTGGGLALKAVTAASNTELWTSPTIDEADAAVGSLVSNGLFVFAITTNRITAITLEGPIAWSREQHPPAAAMTPLVRDGLLIAADGAAVVARRAGTGNEIWRVDIANGQPAGSIAAQSDEVLVPITGADGSALVALDIATGAEHWRAAVPTARAMRVFTRSGYIVVSSSGALVVLRVADHLPAWSITDPAQLECGFRIGTLGTPVLARGHLFLPHNCRVRGSTFLGGLAKLKIATGELVFRRAYTNAVNGIATGAGDAIYVNSGYVGAPDLYVHRMSNGRVVGRIELGQRPAGAVVVAAGRAFATADGSLRILAPRGR